MDSEQFPAVSLETQKRRLLITLKNATIRFEHVPDYEQPHEQMIDLRWSITGAPPAAASGSYRFSKRDLEIAILSNDPKASLPYLLHRAKNSLGIKLGAIELALLLTEDIREAFRQFVTPPKPKYPNGRIKKKK